MLLFQPITLTDVHPTQGVISFTFPRKMVADPLSSLGIAGSQPDNNAAWWPYFKERHKREFPYWVQGHMLNHHVHGEGKPHNLVPISHTLNTNMSAMIETEVKKRVKRGQVLRYVVEAHWEASRVLGTSAVNVIAHPAAMRRTCGIKGIDPGGDLLWGEQFAPTRLSWTLQERTPMGLYVDVKLDERWRDPSQWYNTFPT